MAQQEREDFAKRIARIHGRVHTINEMLDQVSPHSEVVHNAPAVRPESENIAQGRMKDPAVDCLAKSRRREPFEETLLELRTAATRM